MTDKVRVKVKQRFVRNVGGQIVHGNPDKKGADYLELTREQATLLGPLVTSRGVSQKAGDGVEDGFAPEGEGEGVGGGNTGSSDQNPDGAAPGGPDGHRPSAQAARERRAAGEPKPGDTANSQKRGGRPPKARVPAKQDRTDDTGGADQGAVPTGGDDTIATTGHPGSAGAHDASGTDNGAVDADDPDAAPTGG